MKEASVSLGVRPLVEELQDPRQPELQRVDWTAELSTVQGRPVANLTNPRKARFVHTVVRALMGGGNVVCWDQPVIYENPGAIFAPVRYRRSGKGQKDDQLTVYMILVQRPIVKPCLNLPGTVRLGESTSGVMSLEFPRGISDKLNTPGLEFMLSSTHGLERVLLLGDQALFDAAGGRDEFEEEVPSLTLLPGIEPILVGGSNANTAYFGTNQSSFVVPIAPRLNRTLEQSGGTVQQEFIRGLVPLRYPEETDQLLENSVRIVSTGVWDSKTPVLIDNFTVSMLAHVGRLLRQGKLPVTG